MASFSHMTDLTRSEDEKSKEHMDSMLSSPFAHMPDVPPGLCIALTENELEKLELDDDCQVGDYLHGKFMARVTSINKTETDGKSRCRIELSVLAMNLEDESTENPGEEEDDD